MNNIIARIMSFVKPPYRVGESILTRLLAIAIISLNQICACSSVDRASVFGTGGRGFESHQARQQPLAPVFPTYIAHNTAYC